MKNAPAVPFVTLSRVHLGLEVADLARSVDFYRKLLGTEPVKVRQGYAKFLTEEPSMNLSLHERPGLAALPQGASHFGLEVRSSAAVGEAFDRLTRAGLEPRAETNTVCCYALQDKCWVDDPDGHAWEVFVFLGDAAQRSPATAECCTSAEGCCGD